MIEWSLFYRMLGIPEEVPEPTYYDLLGLHPKACNEAKLEAIQMAWVEERNDA